MTTEETIEGNKLIAEFMEAVKKGKYFRFDEPNGRLNYSDFELGELEYNTSWDWLMPVVEKIESLGFAVEITETYCDIASNPAVFNSSGTRQTICGHGGGDYTKISATYKTCLTFITLHNSQPKQN